MHGRKLITACAGLKGAQGRDVVFHGTCSSMYTAAKGFQRSFKLRPSSNVSLNSYCGEGPTWACRSVVQFAYGEDGLDLTKKSFMREFGFLARNAQRFAQQVDLAGAQFSSSISGLKPVEAAAQKRNR